MDAPYGGVRPALWTLPNNGQRADRSHIAEFLAALPAVNKHRLWTARPIFRQYLYSSETLVRDQSRLRR